MKSYSKRNRLFYVVALSAILVSTIFSVTLQFFKGDILDAALAGNPSRALRCILLLLLFLLCENLFYFLYAWYTAKFVTGCTKMLKRDIFQSILQRSYTTYKKHPQGWYIAKYTKEADDIKAYRFQMLPLLWEILLKVLFVSAALFLLDPRIAVLTLILLTTPLYLPKLIEKPLQTAQTAELQTAERVLTCMQDWLSGFEIIKNFSAEEGILQKFNAVQDDAMHAMLHNATWKAVSQLITALMSYLSYFIILAFSAGLVLTGRFSAGDFFVAIGMIDQLSYPLISLAEILRALVSIHPTCQSMQGFLAASNDSVPTRPLHSVEQAIAYHAVAFCYPDSLRPVLRERSFILQKGKRYLLQGPSGCGKTTAVNLLLRYYDPTSGKITVDGRPLSAFDSTYPCVTVVRQEAILFHASLRDNLTLYRELSDEALFRVLRSVGLDRFANHKALDAIIAENGTNLSGGEKKRLCLARALLRETDVLILDEPLANLDDETAAKIEDLLLSIQGKILLLVSHQFSAEKVKYFDGVIRFDRA